MRSRSTARAGRLLRAVSLAAAMMLVPSGAVAQHVERVEVARVVVDVRVLDPRGRQVRGLGLDDFRVLIDDRPARLESVRWEGAGNLAVDPAPAPQPPDARATASRSETAAGGAPAGMPTGRLIVLFFQKDLLDSRVTGLRLLLERARRLTERAAPDDRFAIVSFDSHLRVWLDFTTDRASLRRVLEWAILLETPPRAVPGPPPSFVAAIDPAEARRAASMEQALAVVARALEPVVGAKSLVLFAWGYGRIAGARVVFDPELAEAAERLRRSRVAVFSLDVTQAEHHTLESGMQAIADATGGFYLKTHDLPDVAMARLESALDGHYVLMVEKPERRPGTHAIRVELTRARRTVLARPAYVDDRQ